MMLRKRNMPRLCSDRLIVRLLEPHEAGLMVRFREENRDHLKQWEPTRQAAFFTEGFWEAHLRLTLRDFREGTSVSFVLMSPSEDEVLGVCNYSTIVRGTFQSCHLGYALAEKHEGKGIMFEALSLANTYMFSDLGLHRIIAGYLPYNVRSEKLLDRLGFEQEGLARKYLKINGRWEDHVLTALINDPY